MSSLFVAFLTLSQTSGPFTAPIAVAEPQRLALTPIIDGTIESGEWDRFATTNGRDTFFQWEPGRLHVAATCAPGEQIVVSLDLKADGWLQGRDNLEVRFAWSGGRLHTQARWFDCGIKGVFKWVPATAISKCMRAAGNVSGGSLCVEATLLDGGSGLFPQSDGSKCGIRIDPISDSELASVPMNLRRQMTIVKPVFARGSNLPGGLKWGIKIPSREVGPGGELHARVNFIGANEMGLRKMYMSVEGPPGGECALLTSPFPAFDDRGNAFVDYSTRVPEGISPGYRLIRAEVVEASGQTSVLKFSWRVTPLVFFEAVMPNRIEPSPNKRQWRLPIYIVTKSPRRTEGRYGVRLPKGWSVKEGGDRNFDLRGQNATERRVLQVMVPGGARGVYPLTLIAGFGKRKIEQTFWAVVL